MKNIFPILWKTTTAYMIVSFGVVQLADVVVNNLSSENLGDMDPASIMQTVFLLVGAGFPLALLVAVWIEQSKSNTKGQSKPTSQDSSAGLASVPGDYKQKLAIIPFENLNEDEGDGLLVDGIVEDLITEFSMIKELEIVSRKACFDMRQSGLTHDQLKAVWSLDFVVSGSIRSIQDRIRISAELSELETGKVVWSSKFDRFKTDIFEIQDEIVRKIVLAILGEIEISSLHRADRKPTANMTSYECLLKGRTLHHKFSKAANEQAIQMLNAAIEADQNNSQAYAWKACVLGQALGRGYSDDPKATYDSCLENINKAVEINNNDFEAHRMLAEVHITLHDFEKAKMHGAKSFSINPNDPRVLSVYGEALLRTGQIDSGIEYLEKAYELDPVPQGQSTSDRRISALLLARFIEAKTKESSLEECSRLKDKLVEHDKRSWLISIAILERQGQDYAAESWYSDNYAEFSKSDWPLEIDRFHLNDKSMEDSLLQLADNLPEPEN